RARTWSRRCSRRCARTRWCCARRSSGRCWCSRAWSISRRAWRRSTTRGTGCRRGCSPSACRRRCGRTGSCGWAASSSATCPRSGPSRCRTGASRTPGWAARAWRPRWRTTRTSGCWCCPTPCEGRWSTGRLGTVDTAVYLGNMTVPPNYSMPPERPTPGYGYQPQYGGPSRPEEPRPRNYALIGAIVIGCTVIALGTILLITLSLSKGDEKDIAGDDTEESVEPDATTPETEEETTAAVEETTPVADESEIGECLPYEPAIAGDGLELLSSCDDPEAFWEITNQSYDVDAPVDSDGNLLDNQVAYDLCG